MKKSYTGKHTEQAVENFPFRSPPVHLELLYAIATVKKAAAHANMKAGTLSSDIAGAISQASDELLEGKFDDQFPLPAIQGGAGTSINMNVNEILASRATELLETKNIVVHPNDHVNMAQSTNDVNPSALKLVCIELTTTLLSTIESCVQAFSDKGKEFSTVQKLGRTHLQDAVPVTLGSEFDSYAATIDRNRQRIKAHLSSLYELNLGGTAVGNAINAPKAYRDAVYTELANLTGYPVVPAQNFMSQTSSQTDFVSLSQAILALTIDASKIANDLRLMSSGPVGGLGEISLEELQAGSSIMPGKVNPILPEAVNQLYYTVSGNNLTIEHASHASFLELANMFPILADRLISSLKLSTDILRKFTEKCVVSIRANTQRCTELLEKSTAYATLLTPVLGYDPVSAVVKESVTSGKSIRELILAKNMMTEDEFNKVTSLL